MNTLKIIPASVLAMLLGLCCCPRQALAQCCGAPAVKQAPSNWNLFSGKDRKEATTEIRLRIEGMTCDQCAESVRKALLRLKGVKEAKVSLELGTASVKCEEGKVQPESLQAAVAAAGGKRHQFSAALVSNPALPQKEVKSSQKPDTKGQEQ